MADAARLAAQVWYGDGPGAAAARAALAPASLLYGAAVRLRGALYDARVLSVRPVALPAVAIGNVTVGGTGKTPFAAWLARRLGERGARPAIVLRGYGDDEPRVHALLAPSADVVVDADRVRGVAEAARRGADVAVLDDAFQHRRAHRDADVVLVSAEHAARRARVLPTGPYREPLSALRRASVIAVTRKSASVARAEAAATLMAAVAEEVPVVRVALTLGALCAWPGSPSLVQQQQEPLTAIAGTRVLAVAAIGDPDAFFTQLASAGAEVVPSPFADHHAYTRDEAEALARRGEGVERIVCTLKDAVKLGPLWPRLGPPLWYVSQRVAVEAGGGVLDDLVTRLLAARARHSDTTGMRRPL